MHVTFACPQCDQPARQELLSTATALACTACGGSFPLRAEVPAAEEKLSACVVCGGQELFVRKDFSQNLGVAIVVAGLAASCIPWYFHMWYATFGILFGTALVDLVLYFFTGNLLECYRCHAHYRGLTGLEAYEPFQLEVFERHRQQAARLAQTRQPPS